MVGALFFGLQGTVFLVELAEEATLLDIRLLLILRLLLCGVVCGGVCVYE